MTPWVPAPPACPVCGGPVEPQSCQRCGLIWRTPSARSVHVGPEGPGPRATSRSFAFRPRLGEVLATSTAMVLYTPVAVAVFRPCQNSQPKRTLAHHPESAIIRARTNHDRQRSTRP